MCRRRCRLTFPHLSAASNGYWTFWTLITVSWFICLIVNALFNDFWYATPALSAKALIDEESHMRSASLGHYSNWDSCAGGKQMSLKCKRLDDI